MTIDVDPIVFGIKSKTGIFGGPHEVMAGLQIILSHQTQINGSATKFLRNLEFIFLGLNNKILFANRQTSEYFIGCKICEHLPIFEAMIFDGDPVITIIRQRDGLECNIRLISAVDHIDIIDRQRQRVVIIDRVIIMFDLDILESKLQPGLVPFNNPNTGIIQVCVGDLIDI